MRYQGGGGISNISLSIARGEVFGFLGPNGAGKTTAIRLMLDLIRPQEGSITVFGLDSRTDSVEIRRRLGYLPGELALYDRLTARELLSFFSHLRGGLPSSAAEAQAELLSLELDRPIRSMSKGNRQKVGLAAAFMGDPDLLVLDEPTSGLDPIVQKVVHTEIRRAADEGRTVLLSSHVLSEVGQIADRVGLIREGRLIAVERVVEMQQRSRHLIDVLLASQADAAPFEALGGAVAVRAEGQSVHLELAGSLNELVEVLASMDLVDLSIREPTLEELFLHFYEASHD
jgi:ABC-2 type transport system ATP-binding protein